MSMASRAIFSNFFEEQWTQNHPQYLSGLSVHFFRQPFLKQLYMKSNYDRSKTISRKTTKNYHPCADDPRLLKICRHVSIEALKRGRRKAIDYLSILVHWKYALRSRLVYNFGFLSLKIVKLAFHVLEMDFWLFVSATVIALPKNHPTGVLFWLFVYFIFSEIKTQNFRDDALLVQEIYSLFI